MASATDLAALPYSKETALEFVARLHEYRTTEELTARLLRQAEAYGIRTATFVSLAAPGKPVHPKYLFGQGDAEWGHAYIQSGAYRRDPAVPAVFNTARPFFWSDLVTTGVPAAGRSVFGLAADFGHHDGFNIPVIGRNASVSTVIMTSQTPLRLSAHDRNVLALLGTAFAQRGVELTAAPAIATPPGLTPRESQCLAWVADGKSDWAISEILSIAQPTVHMHVENARRKLGCRTRFQAVTEAWRRGWLIMSDGGPGAQASEDSENRNEGSASQRKLGGGGSRESNRG